jgi:hypothetical protein
MTVINTKDSSECRKAECGIFVVTQPVVIMSVVILSVKASFISPESQSTLLLAC